MPTLSAIDTACEYIRRGWRPIHIPPREKNPGRDGWQSQRIAESDLREYFRADSNIGVLNGEPSGWLVDIDLDHPLAASWPTIFYQRQNRNLDEQAHGEAIGCT